MPTPDWTYLGRPVTEEDLEGQVGFVYIITNMVDRKKYIGKKLLTRAHTRMRKKKKVRSRVPSDWKTYFGSNKELLEDVKRLGEGNFTRKILRFCKSKGSCSYHEAKHQFATEALLRDDYYNTWITCKIHKTHVK